MEFLSRLRRQDWWLNGALAVLALVSFVSIASARPELAYLQGVWYAAGFVVIAVVGTTDLRPLLSYRWVALAGYLGVVLLLAATLLVAPEVRGTRSWIPLGPFQLQSAELAKVMLIILWAYFFARRHMRIAHLQTLLISFSYLLAPVALIMAQPDWGSAMVLLGLWAGYLLVSGIRWRHLATGFLMLAAVAGLTWQFFLAPYQQERILGFLDPSYDPLGINYSVIQSKIAIGSAGWLGKGFAQGTQVQLGFLTEPATDFIFASLTEEWGLIGALLVIGSFGVLVARTVRTGLCSEDAFSQFLCLGTALLFLIEFAFNMGSTLGLLPVVGVTFPFFSYGGSSLLTKCLLLGVVQSIAARGARLARWET